MSNQQEFPGWFLWLWDKGLLGLCTVVLLFVVGLTSLAAWFDSRLDNIEEQFGTAPPKAYAAPNLNALAVQNAPSSFAAETTVYVPLYSHVYAEGGRPFSLEATLSIRNTDIHRPLYVDSVTYYDTEGNLARTYVDKLIRLAPLQTVEFLVEERDSIGGSGANFLVSWKSTELMDPPMIEAVMVGAYGQQSICFSRTGQTLKYAEGGEQRE